MISSNIIWKKRCKQVHKQRKRGFIWTVLGTYLMKRQQPSFKFKSYENLLYSHIIQVLKIDPLLPLVGNSEPILVVKL